jgi:enoyl-CoA hydratase/carnithine racemase
MAEEVLYSVADGVATITLNRPERLNALNGAMYHGLIEAFDQTDRDDDHPMVTRPSHGACRWRPSRGRAPAGSPRRA